MLFYWGVVIPFLRLFIYVYLYFNELMLSECSDIFDLANLDEKSAFKKPKKFY